MAQDTYSLSWFKKRTREINARAGTKISPTQLYRTQHTSILAQELIAETEARKAAAKATRSRIKPADYTKIVHDRTVNVWASFASVNVYASNLLQAYEEGSFLVSPNGSRLYREYNGQWFTYNPMTMDFKPLKSRPVAEPLTADRVNRILADVAKKAKAHTKAKPVEYYTNVHP